MKATLYTIATFLVLGLIVLGIFSDWVYVEKNEICFAYNVSDGKMVNPEDNPILPFGLDVEPGIDGRHFRVNSEINRYSFTTGADKFSPYDEAMTMDSNEGATMSGEYTILGKVTNPWLFYNFFEEGQWSYKKVEGLQDRRIYAALRLAGRFAATRMVVIAQEKSADFATRNPKYFADRLTKEAAEYASTFGFTVTEIIFSKSFTFPNGDAIKTARAEIRNVNSEFETKKITVKKAEEGKKKKLSEGTKVASAIEEEGKQEADRLLSEATALAQQLKASIDQLGGDVDAAVGLKLSSLQGQIMKAGIIPKAYLTEESELGKAFY